MHPTSNAGPLPGAIDRYAIRVLRLDAEEEFMIRVLSTSYSGLMGHWTGRRTEYCHGPQRCSRNLHQRSPLWKGYFAGEVWCPTRKLWFPTVPELTEGAELDLRGRFERGQIWRFWKPAPEKGKNAPLMCALIESHDPALLPRAFDVLPIVASVYHVPTVELGIDNPMPPKTLAVPTGGPGPTAPKEPDGKPAATPQEVRAMLNKLAGKMKLNGGAK